jgi:hypothetical protein
MTHSLALLNENLQSSRVTKQSDFGPHSKRGTEMKMLPLECVTRDSFGEAGWRNEVDC